MLKQGSYSFVAKAKFFSTSSSSEYFLSYAPAGQIPRRQAPEMKEIALLVLLYAYSFVCIALGPLKRRLAKLFLYSYMFIVFKLSYKNNTPFAQSSLFLKLQIIIFISLSNTAQYLAASSSPHSIWRLPLRQRLAQREGAV